jgi:RNA polymerase sigma-70 factor (ECF subfamily)
MEESLPTSLLTVARQEGLSVDDFDSLMRVHQDRIYRLFWCELRDADAAANLTQECFLRAYQHRNTFRGDANVMTWLVRIALNLVSDYRRNRRQSFWQRLLGSSRPDGMGMISLAPSPERILLGREEADHVLALTASLSEQQRTAFLLRFVEELSLEEVAATMDIEVGTVKSHLARSVAALRRLKEVKESI